MHTELDYSYSYSSTVFCTRTYTHENELKLQDWYTCNASNDVKEGLLCQIQFCDALIFQ